MAEPANSTPTSSGHDLTVADLNTSVNHEARVLDTRLAEALGFDRPRNIRKLITRNRADLERFGEVCSTRSEPSATGGRPGTVFYLNRKQALFITAKSDTPRSAEVTIRMVEIYDEHTRRALPTTKRAALARPRKPKSAPIQAPTAAPHFSIDRENLAVMRVGGSTLLVDLAQTDIGKSGRVVCFDSDGNLTVEAVTLSWPHQNWGGRRFGHTVEGHSIAGSAPEHHVGVWVVGTVLGSLPELVFEEEQKPKQIAHAPRRHPRRFDPGSDLKRDLLLLVRSARDRVAKGQARDLGQALAETLEDVIAAEEDPLAPRRGVTLDWNEDRATEDLQAKMRAEGRDPGGLKAREVFH